MAHASQRGDRIVMSWDIALSEIESGDYSACVVLLIRKEIVYILEVVRGRFPFETLKKKVMELKRSYNPSTLLIEDSQTALEAEAVVNHPRRRGVPATDDER
jgi:phage terminase large subunit-like protein